MSEDCGARAATAQGSRPRVAMVSAMGLESSGLAVAAVRYAEAVRARGWDARSIVVGREAHTEHGVAEQVDGFPRLLDLLGRDCDRSRPIVWIGLHTEDALYAQQLEAMGHLADLGMINVVLPERTLRPDREAYVEFERAAIGELGVAGLIHLNHHERDVWAARLPLPSAVVPVPVPDAHFRIGARRLEEPVDAGPTGAVTFMGRLTHRKGADRVVAAWPQWSAGFARLGLDVSLHVYGRQFGSDRAIADDLARLIASHETVVEWHPTFFDVAELDKLPERSVAVAPSRQDFDGIAVSEFLALGLPVLASPTSGHLALAQETEAVMVVGTLEEAFERAQTLLHDDARRRALGRRGRADMRARRGAATVGARLSDLLSRVVGASRAA